MARTAQGSQVCEIVAAAVSSVPDVVRIEVVTCSTAKALSSIPNQSRFPLHFPIVTLQVELQASIRPDADLRFLAHESGGFGLSAAVASESHGFTFLHGQKIP